MRPPEHLRRSRRSLRAGYGADTLTRPPPNLKKETFNVDVSLPEYPYLQPDLKLAARMKQLSQAPAIPEDALTGLVEILKFLGTLGLILVTALIMLMAG
jgi:hypothetical protein